MKHYSDEELAASVDRKVLNFLLTELDVVPATAMTTGLLLGLRIAMRHPEWANAFLSQSLAPDSGAADRLVRIVPMQVIDDDS